MPGPSLSLRWGQKVMAQSGREVRNDIHVISTRTRPQVKIGVSGGRRTRRRRMGTLTNWRAAANEPNSQPARNSNRTNMYINL